jgi:hypothetical protein
VCHIHPLSISDCFDGSVASVQVTLRLTPAQTRSFLLKIELLQQLVKLIISKFLKFIVFHLNM